MDRRPHLPANIRQTYGDSRGRWEGNTLRDPARTCIPRCHEGNYAFPSLMVGTRIQEKAFAEGRGPDPATKDNATDFVGVEENPFQ